MVVVLHEQERSRRRPLNPSRRDVGFTIIELVVIISVMGLLVTLGIVGYGAWRTTIATKEVQNDLLQLASAMNSARIWNNAYPVLVAGAQFGGGAGANVAASKLFESSPGVDLVYANGDGSRYCAQAESRSRPEVVYRLDSRVGRPEPGTC